MPGAEQVASVGQGLFLNLPIAIGTEKGGKKTHISILLFAIAQKVTKRLGPADKLFENYGLEFSTQPRFWQKDPAKFSTSSGQNCSCLLQAAAQFLHLVFYPISPKGPLLTPDFDCP